MKASEILTERFDYSGYIPIVRNLVHDLFHKVQATDQPDPAQKVTHFLAVLQDAINKQVLAPIIADNSLVYNGVQIDTLQLTMLPTFDKPMGKMNLGSMSAKVQQGIRKGYPNAQMPKAGVATMSQYVKGHVSFIGEASFQVFPKTQSAAINMEINGSSMANYLFLMDAEAAGSVVDAGLNTFASGLVGKLFHEVKHYMQNVKIASKPHLDPTVDLNRYYTGDPKTMNRARKYTNTKSGYWLNSDEMDSWASDVAAQIVNIFGTDTQAMVDYLNAASTGQTTMHNNVPVKTDLGHYYRQVFNKRYKVNTPREDIWRKFIKNVYKDIQLHFRK
jgi:hypothetical protein